MQLRQIINHQLVRFQLEPRSQFHKKKYLQLYNVYIYNNGGVYLLFICDRDGGADGTAARLRLPKTYSFSHTTSHVIFPSDSRHAISPLVCVYEIVRDFFFWLLLFSGSLPKKSSRQKGSTPSEQQQTHTRG